MKLTIKIISILGILSVILILIDVFIGLKTSLFVSRLDGSIMYQDSIIFPSFGFVAISIETKNRIEQTGFSEFLKQHVNCENKKYEKQDLWFLLMSQTRGILSGEVRISGTPDMSKRFPINEWNSQKLLSFLNEEMGANPMLVENLKAYFWNIDTPDRSFEDKLKKDYFNWRANLPMGQP